jgi:hypothetical protein
MSSVQPTIDHRIWKYLEVLPGLMAWSSIFTWISAIDSLMEWDNSGSAAAAHLGRLWSPWVWDAAHWSDEAVEELAKMRHC